jgi:hypothetical protein
VLLQDGLAKERGGVTLALHPQRIRRDRGAKSTEEKNERDGSWSRHDKGADPSGTVGSEALPACALASGLASGVRSRGGEHGSNPSCDNHRKS